MHRRPSRRSRRPATARPRTSTPDRRLLHRRRHRDGSGPPRRRRDADQPARTAGGARRRQGRRARTIVDDATAHGLRKVTSFDAGDWLAYDPVNLVGITGVEARAIGTGTLSLRWGADDAEPFLTIDVANTSGAWQEVSSPLVTVPEGTDRLYVTSTGGVELDQLAFTTSTSDIRALLDALEATSASRTARRRRSATRWPRPTRRWPPATPPRRSAARVHRQAGPEPDPHRRRRGGPRHPCGSGGDRRPPVARRDASDTEAPGSVPRTGVFAPPPMRL